MNWEPRFVFFDEDTCIHITVAQATPDKVGSKWYWTACDFPNLEERLLKSSRSVYKSTASARKGAERWYRREYAGDAGGADDANREHTEP